MSFEKFYKSDVQLKLDKMTRKKTKNEQDLRTFNELFAALETAEDKIIQLEILLKAEKNKNTSVRYSGKMMYTTNTFVDETTTDTF